MASVSRSEFANGECANGERCTISPTAPPSTHLFLIPISLPLPPILATEIPQTQTIIILTLTRRRVLLHDCHEVPPLPCGDEGRNVQLYGVLGVC